MVSKMAIASSVSFIYLSVIIANYSELISDLFIFYFTLKILGIVPLYKIVHKLPISVFPLATSIIISDVFFWLGSSNWNFLYS